MPNLKRDRSGDWILRYYTAGAQPGSRRSYHNLGPVTHAEAKERARVLLAANDATKTLADPSITFGKLADRWLELHGPNLRPRTLAGTEAVIRRHLKPAFGAKRVRDLLPIDVEDHRTKAMSAVPPPATSTMNLRLDILGQILAWGARERIVPNPIPPRSIKRLPETEKTVYFEPTEWAKFIAAAEADSRLAVTAPLWRLQLLTASRIGEMAALTWSGVDFARKVITIFQSKVSRSKTLRLSPAMEAVLSGLTRGIREAPVFTDSKGGRWTPARLDYFFWQILKAAELDGGGVHGSFTTHSIRHTAATWARKAEAPLDRVSGILGHRDPKMVLRYAHIQPEDLDGALGAVERAASAGDGRKMDEISRFPQGNG